MATLIALASPASAQDAPGPAAPERDRGWVAFGVGPGSPHDLAGAVTANFGRERIIQLGLHANTDFSLGGRPARVNALHTGAGLSGVNRWMRIALAAGPGLVWGLRESGSAGSGYTTLGGVVSAQVMLTPVPEFGVGLDAFAIVSGVRSALGLGLTVVFEGNK